MTATVIPMPDKLERLAAGIKAHLADAAKDDASAIEHKVQAAIMIAEARDNHKDDISFGKWWDAQGFGLNHQDRAALVAMGRNPDEMRKVLTETTRTSIQHIFAEHKSRFTHLSKPTGTETTSSKPMPGRGSSKSGHGTARGAGQADKPAGTTTASPKPKAPDSSVEAPVKPPGETVPPPKPVSSRKPSPKTVQLDKAVEAVFPLVAAGLPIGEKDEFGKQIGVSHWIVEQAVAVSRERLRWQEYVANLPSLDPSDLSDKSKLKLADFETRLGAKHGRRMLQLEADHQRRRAELEEEYQRKYRKLEADYQKRHADLDKEVDRRVVEDGKAHFALAEERERKAFETEQLYREMMRPQFTTDQFMTIWRCLHPDSRNSASDGLLNTAFNLFESRKVQLTGVQSNKNGH